MNPERSFGFSPLPALLCVFRGLAGESSLHWSHPTGPVHHNWLLHDLTRTRQLSLDSTKSSSSSSFKIVGKKKKEKVKGDQRRTFGLQLAGVSVHVPTIHTAGRKDRV